MKKIFLAFLCFASCKSEVKKNMAGAYEGQYACADCSGIDVHLQINADSSFWLNEKYNLGKNYLRFIDSGKWMIGEMDKLILSGTTHAPHQYKIINDSILEMLDSDGNEIQSTHANQIKLVDAKITAQKVPVGDTLIGAYQFNEGETIFIDCGTQNKTKVANRGVYDQLQKEYLKVKQNSITPIFIKVIGFYSLQKQTKTSGVERVLVVNQLIEINTKDSCR
jgi:uncharacterized lipoprotein NlpE involved in copper resistance